MNDKEFATIASAIKAAYPNANIMPDKNSKSVWYTMLVDLDYAVCLAAIKEHMSTNKFAPTIAEIRGKSSEITNGRPKDWGAAWEETLKAVRFKGIYREEEAMESLEPATRECVKRLGFKNICLSENLDFDRANFRKIYQELAARRAADAQLPPGLIENKNKLHELAQATIKQLEQGGQP